MTIYFHNSGELDPRLITTMGVNVKDVASPIGYFGTGLKYAIATLLRTGHEVTIKSGRAKYVFKTLRETIRGKTFEFVLMNGARLGFTTDLGKNWTPQNAYRELWSNAKDEGGKTVSGNEWPRATTCIAVTGPGIEAAHAARHDFLLAPGKTLLWKNDNLEVFHGSSQQVFYRGIGALKFASQYTYNLIADCDLSEDRQLSQFEVCWNLVHNLKQCTNAPLIKDILLPHERTLESHLDFTYSGGGGEVFADAVVEAMKKSPLGLNPTAVRAYYAGQTKRKVEYTPRALTPAEQARLATTLTLLASAGFGIDPSTVNIVETCGENLLGLCLDGKLYVAYECFAKDCLEHCLLEEYLHLVSGYGDCTRDFQNVLFSHLIRLVKGKTDTVWLKS